MTAWRRAAWFWTLAEPFGGTIDLTTGGPDDDDMDFGRAA